MCFTSLRLRHNLVSCFHKLLLQSGRFSTRQKVKGKVMFVYPFTTTQFATDGFRLLTTDHESETKTLNGKGGKALTSAPQNPSTACQRSQYLLWVPLWSEEGPSQSHPGTTNVKMMHSLSSTFATCGCSRQYQILLQASLESPALQLLTKY